MTPNDNTKQLCTISSLKWKRISQQSCIKLLISLYFPSMLKVPLIHPCLTYTKNVVHVLEKNKKIRKKPKKIKKNWLCASASVFNFFRNWAHTTPAHYKLFRVVIICIFHSIVVAAAAFFALLSLSFFVQHRSSRLFAFLFPRFIQLSLFYFSSVFNKFYCTCAACAQSKAIQFILSERRRGKKKQKQGKRNGKELSVWPGHEKYKICFLLFDLLHLASLPLRYTCWMLNYGFKVRIVNQETEGGIQFEIFCWCCCCCIAWIDFAFMVFANITFIIISKCNLNIIYDNFFPILCLLSI